MRAASSVSRRQFAKCSLLFQTYLRVRTLQQVTPNFSRNSVTRRSPSLSLPARAKAMAPPVTAPHRHLLPAIPPPKILAILISSSSSRPLTACRTACAQFIPDAKSSPARCATSPLGSNLTRRRKKNLANIFTPFIRTGHECTGSPFGVSSSIQSTPGLVRTSRGVDNLRRPVNF